MRHRAGLIVAASLSLVGLAALLAGTGRPGGSDAPETMTGPREASIHEDPGDSPGERASLALVEPEVVPAVVPAEVVGGPAEPAPGDRFVTIIGRCVDPATQRAVRGCEVTLIPGTGLATVTDRTDGEGRFRAEVAVHPRERIRIDYRAPGRALVTGRVVTLPEVVDFVDLEDVHLPAGRTLIAQVVDQDGAPVAGLDARFQTTEVPGGARFDPLTTFESTSDANGRIESEVALSLGTWSIELPSYAQFGDGGSGREFEHSGAQQVRIVVRMPDAASSIVGRVLAPNGEPAQGAIVQALDAANRVTGSERTDRAGRFWLVRPPEFTETVRLRARSPGDAYASYDSDAEFGWGSEGVELRLTAPEALRVTVVEAGSGRPVPAYTLHWAKVAGPDGDGGERGSVVRTGQGGALEVHGVPSGSIRLFVDPRDDGLATTRPTTVEHTELGSAVDIEVGRRVTMKVHVRLRDGTPVGRSKVELLRPNGAEAVGLDTPALSCEGWIAAPARSGHVARCDMTETDASGDAQVGVMVPSGPLTLRVSGRSHLPTIVPDIVVQADGAGLLEVVVDVGATVSGTVRPLDVLDQLVEPRRSRVVLTYVGDRDIPRTLARRHGVVDGMGEFSVSGLMAGSWSVQFQEAGFGSNPPPNAISEPFDPVFVKADGAHRIELDVSGLAPAGLSGRLYVDGVPRSGREFDLVRVTPWEMGGVAHASYTPVTTDVDGRFEATKLRAGRYHAVLQGRTGQLISAEAVEVASGERVDHAFHIDKGHLFVRVVDASGAPIADETFVVEKASIGFHATLVSNHDGVIETRSIAGNTYSIRSAGPGPEGVTLDLGEVTVPSGRSSGLVERTADVR